MSAQPTTTPSPSPAPAPAAAAPDPAECNALVDLYAATGGPSWVYTTGFMQAVRGSTDCCRWFGVACNAAGHVVNLDLRSNNLNGTLPASLAGLRHLASLYLNNNALSGSLAPLASLPAVQQIHIRYNNFAGEIPAAVATMPQLRFLYASDNAFTAVPGAALASATSLQVLFLGHNLIRDFPASVVSAGNLSVLHLNNNAFTRVPPILAQFRGERCSLLSRNDTTRAGANLCLPLEWSLTPGSDASPCLNMYYDDATDTWVNGRVAIPTCPADSDTGAGASSSHGLSTGAAWAVSVATFSFLFALAALFRFRSVHHRWPWTAIAGSDSDKSARFGGPHAPPPQSLSPPPSNLGVPGPGGEYPTRPFLTSDSLPDDLVPPASRSNRRWSLPSVLAPLFGGKGSATTAPGTRRVLSLSLSRRGAHTGASRMSMHKGGSDGTAPAGAVASSSSAGAGAPAAKILVRPTGLTTTAATAASSVDPSAAAASSSVAAAPAAFAPTVVAPGGTTQPLVLRPFIASQPMGSPSLNAAAPAAGSATPFGFVAPSGGLTVGERAIARARARLLAQHRNETLRLPSPHMDVLPAPKAYVLGPLRYDDSDGSEDGEREGAEGDVPIQRRRAPSTLRSGGNGSEASLFLPPRILSFTEGSSSYALLAPAAGGGGGAEGVTPTTESPTEIPAIVVNDAAPPASSPPAQQQRQQAPLSPMSVLFAAQAPAPAPPLPVEELSPSSSSRASVSRSRTAPAALLTAKFGDRYGPAAASASAAVESVPVAPAAAELHPDLDDDGDDLPPLDLAAPPVAGSNGHTSPPRPPEIKFVSPSTLLGT
ncbi:hypothetical protein H9P43_004262 [Blastocladiella emersonii ATCC 22665]|nr:hypothetical protein H9P43_004262 [Blastocladiella emersonii ATCC 22665]